MSVNRTRFRETFILRDGREGVGYVDGCSFIRGITLLILCSQTPTSTLVCMPRSIWGAVTALPRRPREFSHS